MNHRVRNNFIAVIASLNVLCMITMSCSRGNGPADGGGGPHVITDQDTIAPVVTINTPASNQVFSSGANIIMTGRITDDLGLYQGTVKLVNDATGELLKSQAYEIHGFKLYDYTVTYSPSVTVATDMTVTVSFVDHGLNNATQSVKIKVNP